MRRALQSLLLSAVLLALFAPLAVAASGADGGEGLWGETDDKVVTTAWFILIAAIPLFILLVCILQWRLERRKTARLEAAKARRARADVRGGW
jgi:hypothetical protein